MSTRISAAITRTATAPRAAAQRTEQWLAIAQVITSPETQLRYEIERLLGQGGFGQVYLARRLGRSTLVPETVCIKISHRIDGWLREAYFGHLLDGHPRAIRLFDAFPLMEAGRSVSYCLAIEYAHHGDLSAFLRREGRAWRESSARREIAGILEVLGKLHRGQLLHRDLTPLNVFVCEGRHSSLATSASCASKRSPRHHRAHDEHADRAERVPRRRRAEMAGARRRVSGGAAAGDARQG
jgi:serine/threonine-protein kinase